jgi:putative oxidoreductase
MKSLILQSRHWLTHLEQPFQSTVLLVLRLLIGWQFYITGKGKLAHFDKTAGFFESLHIPAPRFHAGFVGTVEMVGGLLLFFGLGTRFAAVPLAISMLVAYLTAHLPTADDDVHGLSDAVGFVIDQAPFAFLIVCLVMLAFGPGKISLDHLAAKKFRKV